MADTRQARPPRLLLTGFEPFGEFAVNPSWELVQPFGGTTIGMVDVETALLPVNWATAWPTLQAAIEATDPGWVLMLGVAGSRTTVQAEVRARNLTNPLRDTAGGLPPPDDRIEPDGPPYRISTIPATLVVERLQFAGVPAQVSTDAGGFLCNWTLYKALQAAAQYPRVRGIGFIHLPPMAAQGGPEIADATLRQGLSLVIGSIVSGAAPLFDMVAAEMAAERRPAGRGATHG